MKTGTVTAFEPVRAAWHDEIHARMPDHVARLALNDDAIAERQRDGLRALLAVAQACSPFYAHRLAGITPGGFDVNDLAPIPFS